MEALLTIRSGRTPGKKLRVTGGARIVLGRATSAGLQLLDEGVSRHHCVVEIRDGKLTVTDLNSSNGTYVNNAPVRSRILKDGDLLRVGLAAIEVSVQSAPGTGVQVRRTTTLRLVGEPGAVPGRKDTKQTLVVSAAEAAAKAETAPDARALENLQALYGVASALAGEEDLARLFDRVADQILKAVRADRVALLVRGRNSDALEPAAVRLRDGVRGGELTVSRTVVEDVVTRGVAALSQDASSDDRYKTGQSIVMQQIRSVMCVPLKGKTGVLGAIYADSPTSARAFGEEDLELLSAIGHQAGLAIERTQLIERLEDLFIGAIRTLVETIDAKDRYTHGHSERVTGYALALADVAAVAPHDREIVELAGLLHDVGKIGVPEAVLNKPGRLDDAEFECIKLHPAHGAKMILNIPHPDIVEVAAAVRGHHERYDGGGYPDGLKGEEAALPARILTVADAYDAMTSDRPYRKGFAQEKALGILRECAGSQFDAGLATAFEKAARRGLLAPVKGASKYSADTGNYAPVPSRPGDPTADADDEEEDPTLLVDPPGSDREGPG